MNKKTIALVSWWKDSELSILEAMKESINIDGNCVKELRRNNFFNCNNLYELYV